MNKRFLLAAGAVIVIALLGIFVRFESDEVADLMVSPRLGPFRVAVTTTGELRAKNSVKIYGPSSTRQLRIFEMKILRLVPEGTVIKKGQFVAELDRSEVTSRINDANLELQKAQSQYEQAMLDTSLTLSRERDNLVNLEYAKEEARLRQEQAVYEAPSLKRQAEIDFEKAQRALEQAVENYQTQVKQGIAKMREVGAELSKNRNQFQLLTDAAQQFTIMAPENGMVVYKRDWRGQKLTTGGTVNAWDPVVAELPDLSVMESVTYVNEVDIQKLASGQKVEIGLDADPDKKLTGTVVNVANIGEQRPNSDAKVFEVAITVNESDTTLRPAMTTSNTIVVAELQDVVFIPLEAIHTSDSLNFVYARRGGRTVRQEVRLGQMNENEAVVQAGVSNEDRIFLSLPADTSGLSFVLLETGGALAAASPE